MGFVTYFGENTAPSAYVNGLPKTQHDAFVSTISVSKLETWESFARNLNPPLSIFGGTGSLTYSGTLGSGRTENLYGSPSPPGRFNTTGATSAFLDGVWFQSSRSFVITFGAAYQAFGCYITDPGDFRGTMTATLAKSSGGTSTVSIPLNNVSVSGTLAFWGFTDDTETYASITFNITQAGGLTVGQYDITGFDDITLGNIVSPAAIGTLASALDDSTISSSAFQTPISILGLTPDGVRLNIYASVGPVTVCNLVLDDDTLYTQVRYQPCCGIIVD